MARWPAIRQRATGLGEYLTDVVRAVARENPELQGVIDVAEFNATTAGSGSWTMAASPVWWRC